MALSRGMQRSSYNNQTLSNISLQGDRTQNQIAQARRGEETALAGQRSLAAQQLAQQLAQYQQANQSQVAAYADQLRAEDYQKRVAQDQYYNQLQTMLYEYGLQDSARAAASRGSSRGNKKPPKAEPGAADILKTVLSYALPFGAGTLIGNLLNGKK